MKRRKHYPELEAKERAIREAAAMRERGENGRVCPNCGRATLGCFAPPSFGDAGFYTCVRADDGGMRF